MVTDILQPTHLLLILIVALLVLGPKRLPEVGRHLGNGLRDFRNAINGERDSFRDAINFDSQERHPVVEESFSYEDRNAPDRPPAAESVGAARADSSIAKTSQGSATVAEAAHDSASASESPAAGRDRPDARA